jgi:hypothetical protein
LFLTSHVGEMKCYLCPPIVYPQYMLCRSMDGLHNLSGIRDRLSDSKLVKKNFNFYSRAVHPDIIKFLFIYLNAPLDYSRLKVILKFTFKCCYVFRLTNYLLPCFAKVMIIKVVSNWNLLDRLSKILKYQLSYKSVQWQPSCPMRTDGRKHGRTDMTNLTVAFRNFAKVPKTEKLQQF